MKKTFIFLFVLSLLGSNVYAQTSEPSLENSEHKIISYDKEKLLSNRSGQEEELTLGGKEIARLNTDGSDLFGIGVSFANYEGSGTVVDVIINGNEISGFIVDVSEFFGTYNYYIVLDPKDVDIGYESDHFNMRINLTKKQAMAAPEYKFK